MTTRPQRIARMRDMLEELDRAALEMRTSLKESNAEEHQKVLGPVIVRLQRIIEAEQLGYTQFLADELSNVRSGIRRIRLPDRDPDFDQPTPALRALRSARGNLVEALDNALDAAAELQMYPQSSGIELPPFARAPIHDGLIRLDERLRLIEESLAEFAEAGRDVNSEATGPLSEPLIVDVYARKIGIEVDSARFETSIVDQVDIPALSRAVAAMYQLGNDLSKILDNLGEKLTNTVRRTGGQLVNYISKGYKACRLLVHRAAKRFSSLSKSELIAVEEVILNPIEFVVDVNIIG